MTTKKTFESNQEVRWCPGCGDYAILASVQKVLAEQEARPENTVFISGIGCSSRFPYYLNTYGFHTIHGRAPTIATGLKMARPDLNVWVITGDGDGLSIGANHLIHLMRRNVNVTILLFNNRIYGLTKGQVSPTSEAGKVTKTTPQGSIDEPLDPIALALASGCSFVARAIDIDSQGLQSVLKQASMHPGTAFVEIYQNCNVFNDGAFSSFAERAVRADKTLWLTPGELLTFGQHNEKGLIEEDGIIKAINIDDANKETLLRQTASIDLLMKLCKKDADLPIPVGIFRAEHRPTYESLNVQKSSEEKLTSEACQSILEKGATWTI